MFAWGLTRHPEQSERSRSFMGRLTSLSAVLIVTSKALFSEAIARKRNGTPLFQAQKSGRKQLPFDIAF